MAKAMKKNRKIKVVALIVLAFVAAVVTGCAVYLNDYYKPDETALAALQSDENVTVEKLEKDALAFIPEDAAAALIFYPGGKVDYEAYAPLMRAYAEQGILCILPEMPFQLAVFDMDAAERYRGLYPEIDTWYLGGHSLGGSMAASHLEKNAEEYEGLLLLASYSTADISDTDLEVISIFGSEDKVLNAEKYAEYKGNLPMDLEENVIEGGNHAYFGSYGAQEGDGVPTITNEEQITRTVEITVEWME